MAYIILGLVLILASAIFGPLLIESDSFSEFKGLIKSVDWRRKLYPFAKAVIFILIIGVAGVLLALGLSRVIPPSN